MNQVVSKIYQLLEKHALANDEVSGFRFLTSPKFRNERQHFFKDLEEHFKLNLTAKESGSIKNLAELIKLISQKGAAFQS